MSDFIKVSQKDSQDFTIVPKLNSAFYKKQGYEVDEPTPEEIASFFPNKKETSNTVDVTDTPEYNAISTELQSVKAEKAELELKLTETEKQLEDLKKQLNEVQNPDNKTKK